MKLEKQSFLSPLSFTVYHQGPFVFGTTFKSSSLTEFGNMALHVSQNPDGVLENRKLLASYTLPLKNWALAQQSHENHCVFVQKDDKGKGAFQHENSFSKTDALFTNEPGILLGVHTADCIGLVLYDESSRSFAVIHSGWRSTAKAIVLEVIHKMKKEVQFNPKTAKAYFAPSLQTYSLEVGMDVIDAMHQLEKETGIDVSSFLLPHSNPQKAYLDNQGLCAAMLYQEGFLPEHVFLSSIDTKTDPTCFSFRRDGQTPEHFTFAYIDPKKIA